MAGTKFISMQIGIYRRIARVKFDSPVYSTVLIEYKESKVLIEYFTLLS